MNNGGSRRIIEECQVHIRMLIALTLYGPESPGEEDGKISAEPMGLALTLGYWGQCR